MLNVARNFIYLVPELGDYLNQNALAKVRAAVDEYHWIAPYWFVSRYDAVVDEGVVQPLYDVTMLLARAYALKEPFNELSKYLDAPGFARGDLLYIQNLIAVIESAQPSAAAPMPATIEDPESTPNTAVRLSAAVTEP
jgi:hypothetical protein